MLVGIFPVKPDIDATTSIDLDLLRLMYMTIARGYRIAPLWQAHIQQRAGRSYRENMPRAVQDRDIHVRQVLTRFRYKSHSKVIAGGNFAKRSDFF
ncbi:hypothetical protein WJ06_22535 [Burkholderia cepacia]|nr:hypothetical protein WJ06_22535 [Burkholderia cepacia]